MDTAIAVIAALGAACCFALAAVIQHRAARGTGEQLLSLRLLLTLVRNPRWAAGAALAGLSFAIQGWRWRSARWPWYSHWQPPTYCSPCR